MIAGALAVVVSARAADYRVETVASGFDHPGSLAFLPDGRMLVTERVGRLRLIEPGPDGRARLRPEPVAGVPAVLARGQAGLFDVVVDPALAVNGQVMLSFAYGMPEANHLRVVRARFDGRQLREVQPVFTSQPAKAETQHFGGRMAWLADGTQTRGKVTRIKKPQTTLQDLLLQLNCQVSGCLQCALDAPASIVRHEAHRVWPPPR